MVSPLDSAISVLLAPKSHTLAQDRATAKKVIGAYIAHPPDWAKCAPAKRVSEMTQIAASLLQTTDRWPPAAASKRRLGAAILEGILAHSWRPAAANAAEVLLGASLFPTKSIPGRGFGYRGLFSSQLHLNFENWVSPIFDRLNRLAVVQGVFQTDTLDLVCHHRRVIYQDIMPYAQVYIRYDSDLKSLARPERMYANSNAIDTPETMSLSGCNAEITLTMRARLLLQWAKKGETSVLRGHCVAIAKTLIGTAVLAMYQGAEWGRLDFTRPLTNFSKCILLNVIDNGLSILAHQSKENGYEQLFPLASHHHQAYLGICAMGPALRVTYYNLGYESLDFNRDDGDGVSLLQIKLHPKDSAFAEFKNRLMGIFSGADTGFEALRIFFHTQLETSPDTCRLTDPVFKLQTSGNCVFEGISAFLKLALGDDYTAFRNYENSCFLNAISPTRRQCFPSLI